MAKHVPPKGLDATEENLPKQKTCCIQMLLISALLFRNLESPFVAGSLKQSVPYSEWTC